MDFVADAMRTKVVVFQPDMLSAPTGAFLRALVEVLQADGLGKLLHFAEQLRPKLPSVSGDDTSSNDEHDDELFD
jgi:hypothetical protein